MNLPGFAAESSLGPVTGIYRGKAVFGGSGRGEVSLQQFGASSVPGHLSPVRGFLDVTIRCCGYSTRLHQFVCTTHTVSPFEQCECQQDFFGHPVVICRPPVFSPD
jgi:hypothetical protein